MDRGELVTREEQEEILNWICERYLNPKYDLYENRLNIIVEPDDPEIPQAISTIRQRLVEKEGLQSSIKEIVYKDFINIIKPGGSLHIHNDKNIGHLIHTRFNVLLLLPKGPVYTYYKAIKAEENERHYIISRSGLDYHWTDTNTSTIPRISISYGFMLTQEKLDSLVKPLPTTFYYILILLYVKLNFYWQLFIHPILWLVRAGVWQFQKYYEKVRYG